MKAASASGKSHWTSGHPAHFLSFAAHPAATQTQTQLNRLQSCALTTYDARSILQRSTRLITIGTQLPALCASRRPMNLPVLPCLSPSRTWSRGATSFHPIYLCFSLKFLLLAHRFPPSLRHANDGHDSVPAPHCCAGRLAFRLSISDLACLKRESKLLSQVRWTGQTPYGDACRKKCFGREARTWRSIAASQR